MNKKLWQSDLSELRRYAQTNEVGLFKIKLKHILQNYKDTKLWDKELTSLERLRLITVYKVINNSIKSLAIKAMRKFERDFEKYDWGQSILSSMW